LKKLTVRRSNFFPIMFEPSNHQCNT